MSKKVYTMEQWSKDGTLNLEVGQEVAREVILELRDCVPPTSWGGRIFQPGEGYTVDVDYHELFQTFTNDGEGFNWTYRGLCRRGEIIPRQSLY